MQTLAYKLSHGNKYPAFRTNGQTQMQMQTQTYYTPFLPTHFKNSAVSRNMAGNHFPKTFQIVLKNFNL
jgi:hypothetical protein